MEAYRQKIPIRILFNLKVQISQVVCVGNGTATTAIATTTTSTATATTGGTVGCSQTYSVVSGDSCYAIAQRFGLDLNAFMQANNIQSDCGNLQATHLNFLHSEYIF